jgi:hypothetical protein
MKTARNGSEEYNDCIVDHFGFNNFATEDSDKMLFWGWAYASTPSLRNEYNEFKKKYFINTAAPCDFLENNQAWANHSTIDNLEYFDKVYTICPYTAEWINNTKGGDRYVPICFPYPEHKFDKYRNTTFQSKQNDVYYYGQVHHAWYDACLQAVSNLRGINLKFSTISSHNFNNFPKLASLVTDYNVTSEQKWDLLNKSKVTFGCNLLFTNEHHREVVRSYDSWEKNKAFEWLDSGMVPQMKTRMVEAAAAKTLMLVAKDNWNVIEHWFSPGHDFLYFDTPRHLKEILPEILNNYEKYWHIVENAHETVQQFTTKKLWDQIAKG